jgi:hypothetical protein
MSNSKKVKISALQEVEHFNAAKLWYLVEEKRNGDDAVKYINNLLECKTSEKQWPYATLKVSYDYPSLGFGRLSPKGNCFTLMDRKTRYTIADNMYIDLDIVNCHPILLKHILQEEDQLEHFPFFKQYVDNREQVLEEVQNCFDSRSDAKQWFIKVLFGGVGIHENQAFNAFMRQYVDEMKTLDEFIRSKETLWEYDVIRIRNYIISNGESENLERKVLSHVLSSMECSIFFEAQKFFTDSKCDLSVYTYDGGMSYKPKNLTPIDESFLEKLNQYIFLALNLKITFIVKPIDEAIFIGPPQLISYSYAKFKSWCVEQRGDYASEKAKFERENFFGVRDVMYYTEEPMYVRAHAVNEFKQKYEHLVFRGEDKKGNPCLKQFLCEWVKDPEKRRYDLVGLFPPGFELEETDVTYFSKWKGFPVERVISDGNEYLDAIERFRNHTLYLCSNNQEYRTFLEKCIVKLLKFPGRKLDMVLAFKAIKGGEGKNTWWEIHKELFGANYCYSTQNHDRDWFGDFNELLHEKVWLHMEEMSKHTLLKNQKSFLAYVTSKYDTLNFKGGSKRCVASFCNYFITFNTGGLDMFPGLRRRIWVHEMDKNAEIKNSEYFQLLYKDMKNPQIMRAYYDWLLKNVNVDTFNPAEDRPITPYMERLFAKEHLAKNATDDFIHEMLTQWFFNSMIPNVYKIRFSDLQKMYTQKCKEDQVSVITPQKLASAITDMFPDSVERKKVRGNLYMEFKIDECIDSLVENKMFKWEDLGDSNVYEDCTVNIIIPCRKSCTFRTCRAHLSYHFEEEGRTVRYFRSLTTKQNISHTCPCGGSFFIESK